MPAPAISADDVRRRPHRSFTRVAAGVPRLVVGDVRANVTAIVELYDEAVSADVSVVVFPELSLCGYTIADLVHNELVLDNCRDGLDEITEATRDHDTVAVVGLPWRIGAKLFNVAAVVAGGEIYGIVAKTWLPNYGEFYEQRWFTSGSEDDAGPEVFEVGPATVGVELCEDLWVPDPPSVALARGGADVILNLSASNELLGKDEWRRTLVRAHSGRLLCGYVYVSSGVGESVADTVFGGHAIIAENGTILAESKRFSRDSQLVVADLDIAALATDRRHVTTFRSGNAVVSRVPIAVAGTEPADLRRRVDPSPFVPDEDVDRRARCEEILAIQTAGLISAMAAAHVERLVLGISGGLDSTLAALVATRALDALGLDRANLVALVMPGHASSDRTQSNAELLVKGLGATCRVTPIAELADAALVAIGHDTVTEDITYENTQARMRTLLLFNTANAERAIVVGTGDLSELAIGWCTFNGDHMSNYNVNVGVPKTLVRHLVRTASEMVELAVVSSILADIIDTPISPELTSGAPGEPGGQETEAVVGPYELIDFFLYRLVRHGDAPTKIAYLAGLAFEGRYDADAIAGWLSDFLRRFTANQFKRDALPNGPKVGTVSLSPRADWRMSPQTGDWYRQI